MMSAEMTALVGMVCAVLGALAGVLGYRRGVLKDVGAEGKDKGALLTELRYLRAGVDEIRRELERQRDRYTELKVGVSRAEADVRQAHKRIDMLSCN